MTRQKIEVIDTVLVSLKNFTKTQGRVGGRIFVGVIVMGLPAEGLFEVLG
jgi:hypothetical protein